MKKKIYIPIKTLTLNTSEKNPLPIFSQVKSSKRVRFETACLRALHEEPVIRLSLKSSPLVGVVTELESSGKNEEDDDKSALELYNGNAESVDGTT